MPYQYSPLYYEDVYDENENLQVCYKPLYSSGYYYDIDDSAEYPSFITFDEFQSVWQPLTEEEIIKLGLNGDRPERNKTPYYLPPIEELYPITP
ncbi:MAG: hypothetical protein IKP65_04315 [Alphaproteobacteria bacterium]|nr:hypothetical protein [Alphaproteobacteria bacterium]